jgi:hypothetical protein
MLSNGLSARFARGVLLLLAWPLWPTLDLGRSFSLHRRIPRDSRTSGKRTKHAITNVNVLLRVDERRSDSSENIAVRALTTVATVK